MFCTRRTAFALAACTTTALGGRAVSIPSSGGQPGLAGTFTRLAQSQGAQGGGARLVGRFSPTQQRTGALAPTQQIKVFGSIELTVEDSTSHRTHVVLDVNTPVNNETVTWAIHPGQCGGASLPLLAITVFPAIELGSNGRGHIEADIPLDFPKEGQFHANIYNPGTGAQLDNVMTCASLRYDKPKKK